MALISQKACLRFATQPKEGYGWSEYSGDDWLLPWPDGIISIEDSNGVARLIIVDRADGDAWESGTYDRTTDIKPSATDKDSGAGGTEVASEDWSKEHTAAPTDEYATMLHDVTHAYVRPNNPDNRGATGYTTTGLRSAQEHHLDVYVDGEKTTPLTTTETNEFGDTTFPGVRVRARRHQYVHRLTAGEVNITGIVHDLSGEIKLGSRTERSMSQHSYQSELAQDLKVWLGRANTNPLYDRVSKASLSATYTRTAGPDGKTTSGLVLASNLTLPNAAIATNYTVMMWCKSATPIAGLVFTTHGTSGTWLLIYVKAATGLAASRVILSGNSIFDVRVFDKQISADAIADYFLNVTRDNGKAYIPC